MDPQRVSPPGADKYLGVGQDRQRGSIPSRKMVVDAVTRCGAQGRAAESGRCRVRATSRWAALCTGRGGGEKVKSGRASTMNGYIWVGGRT